MVSQTNSSSRLFKHPNGQITHLIVDDYTDPWDNPKTVLIQGGFARHSAFWYHWVPSLARQYRVVRRDTRGHGKSSTPMPGDGYEYSLDTILSEIIDTLDQLGIDKVHFIGESTSGMLGEALAAKFPNRLYSLTIISSPLYLPPEALTLFSFGHSNWSEACRRLGSQGWGEHLARVPGTLSATDPNYEAWWISQIATNSSDGLAGYAEFLSKLDARSFLSDISVPMLILAPAKSAATKLEEQLEIAGQVPGSRLVVIYGAGHEVYVDKADDCLHAVQDFFSDIESSLVNNS
ncbi:hypothetical protein N7493_005930 [Penicillium malachiteum]|uniref:AB hydrolase-1 domain-containing protein n=1 Tax=Penicillium malachiteum TaxID=1324776 RepID=A0AAD6HLB4_9EURO|nr:hypothetical protein N7493_005930 [Penicillium malachiteum]